LANTERKINYLGWFAIIFLLLGGALSVSKLFIIVGFPLALFYYGWINIGIVWFRKSSIAGFTIMIAIFMSVVTFFVDDWTGLKMFLRLFDFTSVSDKGFLDTYTAGRLNSDDSSVMNLFAYTWSKSPVFGFGVPVEEILDNGYLEFFYLGGTVALAFYIFMLVVILFVALTRRRNHFKCGKFVFVIWILTIVTGIGAPVFTLNRASIFFWILINLAILIVSRKPDSDILRDVKSA
jgi:hypothetical protein